MTDQQPDEQPYGDRPEVETADTEVVHGADGPPADEPDAAELASWGGVTPGEPEPPAVSVFGLDDSDLEKARAAGRILSLTGTSSEDAFHAYQEDPSAYLERRARMIAETDPRPAELAEDSGVEIESSGTFSGFTQGFAAGRTSAQTPPEPEDYLSFDLYRADGSRISVNRAWKPSFKDTLDEIRKVALLMEEAVEGGA